MAIKSRFSFEGCAGGANYDWGCRLVGFGPNYYRRVAMAMPLAEGMRVLDVGCGTAGLGLAVAERVGMAGDMCGLDVSQTQILHAKNKALHHPEKVHLVRSSMDTLPFSDGTFDAVVSNLAFHEVSAETRRAAICEIARVLQPGGFFALVDWARPRWSMGGLLWLPFLLTVEYTHDHWHNTFPALCRERGLVLSTDVYLRSAIRCQVFRKEVV